VIKFVKDYKYSINGYELISSLKGDMVQLDCEREARFIAKKVAEAVIEKPELPAYENKMDKLETAEQKTEQAPAQNYKPKRGGKK
jgi:hypothetical protein